MGTFPDGLFGCPMVCQEPFLVLTQPLQYKKLLENLMITFQLGSINVIGMFM